MGVLIRNGMLVTAQDRWTGDVYCSDGKIAAISAESGDPIDASAGGEVIDASGCYVFPGGVDPHVHMELPLCGTVSADDFESGTAAGVAGGTTSIIDFVIPERGVDPMAAYKARREEASKAVTDYGLHMAITSWDDGTADWMRNCVTAGIPSFKTFMAYRDTVGVGDDELMRIMQVGQQLGAVVMVHAENGRRIAEMEAELIVAGRIGPEHHARSRPPAAEAEATAQAASMARVTGQLLYVVHVSCDQAVQEIAAAREAGGAVYGETCPQYLLLDDSVYEKPGFEGASYVMSPPLRPKAHQERLWEALASNQLQVVATDHCPFNLHGQKDRGLADFRDIPNGAAGIEHRLALLFTHGVNTGRLDVNQFVNITSTRPARIFGMYPRKGSLSVDADADLVVWDPEATGTISAATHRHRCDRSIYEGFEVKGLPSHVVVNGRVQYADGDLRVERGAGRFVERRL